MLKSKIDKDKASKDDDARCEALKSELYYAMDIIDDQIDSMSGCLNKVICLGCLAMLFPVLGMLSYISSSGMYFGVNIVLLLTIIYQIYIMNDSQKKATNASKKIKENLAERRL